MLIHSNLFIVVRRSVKVWTEIIADKTMVARLEQQQIILGHYLPLSAYLFKPVQRILKYNLLLQVLYFVHLLLIFKTSM